MKRQLQQLQKQTSARQDELLQLQAKHQQIQVSQPQ